MAVTVTELTSNSSTANTTDYATAAINPTANTLVLLAVHATRGSSTDPVVPTVATAGGLTWVQVGTVLTQDSGTLRGRFTLFRAMASSPSSSVVTIQQSAAGTGMLWSITQWSGVDTSGTNGSGATGAQAAVFNRVDAATTLTCTLGSAITSGNVAYSASGFLGTQTWAAEAGWTELPATEVSIATPDAKMGGAYRLNSADQSFTATLSTANDIGGGIVEVVAGVTDVTVTPGAAIALGSTPAPVVKVDVPETASIALGVTPAPVVAVAKATTASIGLGLSPAPTLQVTIPIGPALALGIAPTATAVVGGGGVTVPVSAAIGLGSSPQPTVLIVRPTTAGIALGSSAAPVPLIVKAITAALATGASQAPTILVVRPIGPSVALGIAPTATAIIGASDVVVPVAAALALATAPQPNVLVRVFPTSSVGNGSAPTAVAVIFDPSSIQAGSVLIVAASAPGVTVTTAPVGTVTATNGTGPTLVLSTIPVGNAETVALSSGTVTIEED